MAETEIESSYNMTTSNNQQFTNMTALHIRLDTQSVMENTELFLKGAKILVFQDENGNISQRMVKTGIGKANEDGIRTLLSWLNLIVNPQNVQGNFPVDGAGQSDMYERYIEEKRIELTVAIIVNQYYWDIRDEDIDNIVNSIMSWVEPFLTRLIGNEERKSYDNTIKHLESNTVKEQGKNQLKLFG